MNLRNNELCTLNFKLALKCVGFNSILTQSQWKGECPASVSHN